MEKSSEDVSAYPALLQQLRQTRSELARLPSWYATQFVILAIGVAALVAMVAGLFPLFVPPYLLLPFVLIPGWRVFRGERERRAKLRAVTAQMRIVEQRLRET